MVNKPDEEHDGAKGTVGFEPLLTTPDIEKVIGVCGRHINRLTKHPVDPLPVTRIPGVAGLRVHPADFRAWLDRARGRAQAKEAGNG